MLEEGSNEILLAYQDTLHGNPTHDHGASATIGIESPDGTIGSQFLHNQALLGPLQATTALRYTNRAAGPPPPPDVTPPAVPTGLSATAGDRQVALDWADNTDSIAGYRVYRNGSPVATPTGSGYTDTGLTNGSTYTYRVTALDQAGNESAPSNQVSASPQAPVTPPDETSYRLLQEPFSWVDATAGGTALTLSDDASATVGLPFMFRYFGQPFSSVTVSSNGFLVFGSSAATAWVNAPLPNTAAPERRHRRLLGRPQPSPRRQHLAPHPRHHPQPQTVISWLGIRHADTAGPISFQAVLEEGSNEILLAYQDTQHGNPSHDHGASATIGLESPDGTIASQFLHNQPLLAPYQATTALRYTNR